MVQHNFGDTNWTKKCWGPNNFMVKIYFIDASFYAKFIYKISNIFDSIYQYSLCYGYDRYKRFRVKQARVELGLTQDETVSLELGLIKGWTKRR